MVRIRTEEKEIHLYTHHQPSWKTAIRKKQKNVLKWTSMRLLAIAGCCADGEVN